MVRRGPHPRPRFKTGQHVQINLRPPIWGTVVALGYTYMAAPTIVYRIRLDAPRRRTSFWAPRAITSGPYDELVIEGGLQPGEEDFHEAALAPPDAITQLGDLA